ncbi:Ycf66 family protein [Altericista sp. CCNU0014]|uniref:Ycf66 family protein n=1 Tax=Altericista sp. CCNU0014 TaxID=3082949 RepID=UPI00384C3309
MGGIGTPVAILIGVMLLVVGIGLFFLDTFKPGYKRDSDKVYGILFMTLGILSLANWQAGFGVSLLLMVSAGTQIALIVERIRNRTASNEPTYQTSGRSSRWEGDRDRPSRSYRSSYEDSPRSEVRAEFDDEPMSMEEPSRVRRIRSGREEGRDIYNSAYVEPLVEDTREPRRAGSRRSSSSSTDESQYGDERSRRRSPLQLRGDIVTDSDASFYGEERPARTEPASSGRRRSRAGSSLSSPTSEPESELSSGSRGSRRRSRANGDGSAPRNRPFDGGPFDGDYVDYKPLNAPKPPSSDDDDFDNSSNFDDNPSFR